MLPLLLVFLICDGIALKTGNSLPSYGEASEVEGGTCGANGDGLPCPATQPDLYTLSPGMLGPALRISTSGDDIIVDAFHPAAQPLVVVAPRDGDLFTQWMLSDNAGIDDFLSLAPQPQSKFVFIPHTAASKPLISALEKRLESRIAAVNLTDDARAHWRAVLHYSPQSVEELAADDGDNPTVARGAVLQNLLAAPSFQTITKHIGALRADGTWLNVSRLDGFFQFTLSQDLHNHSPENPMRSTLQLAGAEDVCRTPSSPGSFSGMFAVVALSSVHCASPEDAVLWFQGTGASAVVLVAAEGEATPFIGDPHRVLGDNESATFLLATAISYDEEFLALAAAGAEAAIEYAFGAGQYLAFGADGRLAEFGSAINPLLSAAGWLAQGLEYEQELQSNLSAPALQVPLLRGAVGGKARGTVAMPRPQELQRYASAEVELRFSCTGAGDSSCPIWDRIASLQVACPPSATPLELVRWITPYRRRVGHWSVPVTPLLPLLYTDEEPACAVSLSGIPGWLNESWVTDASLRLMPGEGPAPLATTALFSGGILDTSYNNRSTVAVDVSVAPLRKAELVAVITGHGSDASGCCEFQPTRHIFTVGERQVEVSFMEPLDQWACTKRAREGVEPNGYGAWWFGRNGWCNGDAVRPWITDVTEAVAAAAVDGPVPVTYRAQRYDTVTQTWIDPTCTPGSYCGDIDMQSYLTVY